MRSSTKFFAVKLFFVLIFSTILFTGCSLDSTSTADTDSNIGRVSIGTNGKPYIGVDNGLAIDPSTGRVGFDVGGIVIPQGR